MSNPATSTPLSAKRRALLARLLESEGLSGKQNGIVRQPRTNNRFPASYAQQRLWFLEHLNPGSAAYNMPMSLRLRGRLNLRALQRSVIFLGQQHEALRTTFAADEGKLFQVVGSGDAIMLHLHDVPDVPVAERLEYAQRIAAEEGQRPFDLLRGPLFRATLMPVDQDDHVLLLNLHHIIADGWSTGILIRDLATAYSMFSSAHPQDMEPPTVQYVDFTQWQLSQDLSSDIEYWKSVLSGTLPTLNLPTDRPRPAMQTFAGASQSFRIPKDTFAQLKELSRREGGTLFITLLAAFQTLLARYTSQEDIIVGSTISGRNVRQVDQTMGMFVNMLALRSDLSGNPTFRELLARVQKTATGAYSHQALPFDHLVQEIQPERDLSRSPIFQVVFDLNNLSLPGVDIIPQPHLEGLQVSHFADHASTTAKFDLLVSLWETSEILHGTLEYNTDLFDAATIIRLIGHFETLLEGIVAHPDQPLSDLPLLTQAEQHQLLIEWNHTQTESPLDRCLHHLFEAQAVRSPDAVAVAFDQQKLTYAELNTRANQLAHRLRKHGVGPDVLVGISLERSVEMVVGLLGIMKAGGAFLPIDPGNPKERTAFILADARVRVLLTQSSVSPLTPLGSVEVISFNQQSASISAESVHNPVITQNSEHLAYVLYTSGSTGQPKGVEIPHRALVNVLESMSHDLEVTPQDVLLAVSPLTFDISCLEILMPLLVGAQTVIASRDIATDGQRLAAYLDHTQATVMQATPATWRMMIDAGWPGSRSLKIISGGEALPEELAAELLSRCPSLWNAYGPTETTIWSTLKRVDQVTGPVSIGRPIANTEVFILDPSLQPVPVGISGELYIGGAGVARGYLNRPDLTAARFVQNPYSRTPGAWMYRTGDLARWRPDGEIEYLGRLDFQVKIRGFRIELGEIEALLAAHPEVQENVVLAREDTPGNQRLIAYVVPMPSRQPSANNLSWYLKDRLPGYMLPSGFVFLEALPLTKNGKLDRKALPVPDTARADNHEAFEGPRDILETLLQQVWQELLNVQPIGIHDNFFELGGHSLLAMSVIDRLEQASGQKIPVAALFAGATIAELATAVRAADESAAQTMIPVQPTGSRTPLFFLHGDFSGGGLYCRNLARYLGPDQPFYAMSPMGLDGYTAAQSLEAVAAHHVVLLRQFQPNGPYHLGGFCNGGLIAFEMARQLVAQGQQVGAVIMIHASAMNVYFGPLHRIVHGTTRLLGIPQQARRAMFLGVRNQIAYMGGRTRLERRPGKPFSESDQCSDPEYRIRLLGHYGELMGDYIPGRYAGRVILLWPTDHAQDLSKNPTRGWAQIAPQIKVQCVPGNHLTCITHHGDALAAQIGEVLAKY